MSDRWDAALRRIEQTLPLRVVSADVEAALRIVCEDRGLGAVALEHVAAMVEALPYDVREVQRAQRGAP